MSSIDEAENAAISCVLAVTLMPAASSPGASPPITHLAALAEVRQASLAAST